MGRPIVRLVFFTALAGVWIAVPEVIQAQGATKSDREVKVTATADKPGDDGKQTVTVTLQINKGWHVYANPVGNDDYAANATIVTVVAKEKPEDVKVNYPAGKLLKIDDDKFNVYEDKVEIKAVVKRAKGDTSPLEVMVTINACTDKKCLPTATVKVPVK